MRTEGRYLCYMKLPQAGYRKVTFLAVEIRYP